ncbi:MAG: carbohydrate-binding domain-containing protein [Lachnospiraceae bacterium]|nr:carbohydrate-binding domain-containing protein [Lachnospiraceae bacterium]
MSTHNTLDKICVAIVICSLVLTVLFMNGEALGITKIVDEDAEQNSDSAYFTTNDQNGSWDTTGAAAITLTGDGASVSGNGAYVYDGNVVIAEAGRYVFSGDLEDGSIIVDAHDSSKVWILLDGVEINCSDDACIQVDQADKVFLTLAEGSQNILTSGSVYSDTALSDGTDGAIFAHDDLTINGSGSLTVTAQYSHGISANDDLVITGGTITISAVDDAIHVNDSIRIKDAAITVTAGDDGLLTSNEVENGYLYIESGTLDTTASGDGIHTTGDITVAGGEINISVGDDGIHSDASVFVQSGTILISDCYEGIEALIIDVSGGDVSINCEDDGFNANGGSSDMFGGGGQMGGGRNDGTFGHGGMHGSGTDHGTTGERPTPPEMGVEGINGEMPTPPDMDGEGMSGEMPAPPDMSGESMSSGMPADPETDTASGSTQSSADTEDVETYISISGGTVRIVNEVGQDADGMDSNGDIKISGGTIYISLLGTGSNCAVDYASESGGVAEITGGTIIACGASSMAEGFDSTSTQASILYNTSTVAEATTLTVADADGSVLLSWEVPCSFSSALISCPEMKVGGTYTVSAGGTSEEITLEGVSTTYGDSQGGMHGGDMGQSGMPGGGMRPDGQR